MAIPIHDRLLIVLAGPTAVGKTELAYQLAKRYDAPILSADSRQIYRQMDIGTAKPPAYMLREVPHYFINHIDIDTPYSAGQFAREAEEVLQRIFEEHSIALLVGGTGLYIDALCQGLDPMPAVTSEVRQSVLDDLAQYGITYLLEELKTKDPEYYRRVDKHNPRRISRALEVIRQTGLPFSSFRQGQPSPRPFHTLYILLMRPRDELYRRIDARVDDMLAHGWLEEARSLYPYRHLPALQTVGYKELFHYLEGNIDWPTTVEQVKRQTRRYAKRQWTWFFRQNHWSVFHPLHRSRISSYIEHIHRTMARDFIR